MSFINANTYNKPNNLVGSVTYAYPQLMEFVSDSTSTLNFKINSNNAITFNTNQTVSFNSNGAITLPVGNTAQRPNPASNGMMRFNKDTDGIEVYSNGAWNNFLSFYSGNLLVVAGGGGGGGATGAGGGGAGGFLSSPIQLSPGVTYTINVGKGGLGGNSTVAAESGSSSNAFGLFAFGGGGGGSSVVGFDGGRFGGSGGGSYNQSVLGQYGNYGQGISPQGKDGGFAPLNTATFGGGGGANGVGLSSSSFYYAASGGAGSVNPISGSTAGVFSGASYYLAGGGGSGSDNSNQSQRAIGGLGGGGSGAFVFNNVPTRANNAIANTGSGGGGGGPNQNGVDATAGGNGASGIIILSVATSSYSGSLSGTYSTTISGSNTIITWTYPGGSYTA
jgi:hypothetical protein